MLGAERRADAGVITYVGSVRAAPPGPVTEPVRGSAKKFVP
jgi:hypothetical protein